MSDAAAERPVPTDTDRTDHLVRLVTGEPRPSRTAGIDEVRPAHAADEVRPAHASGPDDPSDDGAHTDTTRVLPRHDLAESL